MTQQTQTIIAHSESFPSATHAVRLMDVVKEFTVGTQRIRAIDCLSLEIPSGQFIAIVGRSGSGKSTLLNLLAGIDTPTSGQVWVGERKLSRMTDDDLTRQRRDHIGMVYQFFNLLSTLSVRENVALPALLAGEPEDEALARADALLEEVSLSHRRDARPHTLSGGEMQRTALACAVAITRTLANRHRLKLGDVLTILSAGQPAILTVRQILDSQELQQAMGGNVVIIDIAVAQEVFHRSGKLDRIDLLVDPDRKEAVKAAIQALLPPQAEVIQPQGRTQQVENMVSAFRLSLTALSFIALFVSTFLIFNEAVARTSVVVRR